MQLEVKVGRCINHSDVIIYKIPYECPPVPPPPYLGTDTFANALKTSPTSKGMDGTRGKTTPSPALINALFYLRQPVSFWSNFSTCSWSTTAVWTRGRWRGRRGCDHIRNTCRVPSGSPRLVLVAWGTAGGTTKITLTTNTYRWCGYVDRSSTK